MILMMKYTFQNQKYVLDTVTQEQCNCGTELLAVRTACCGHAEVWHMLICHL
jgi:hypothetical protein